MQGRDDKLQSTSRIIKHSINKLRAATPIHYITFMSFITSINNLISKKTTRTQLFNLMKKHAILDEKHNRYIMRVWWPQNNDYIALNITLRASTHHDDNKLLTLNIHYAKKLLISLYLHSLNRLTMKINSTLSEDFFSRQNLYEIAWHFYDAFKVKTAQHTLPNFGKLYVFTKSEFDDIKARAIDANYNIHARIYNIIMNHSAKRRHNYIFYLNWPDQFGENHTLKAKFSRGNLFNLSTESTEGYSWVFSEKTLLTVFDEYKPYCIPTGQYYYKMQIREITDAIPNAKQQNRLVNFWFTHDAKIGELRDISRGKYLSGNQAIDIYAYFMPIFQVNKMFLCDASTIHNEDDFIPLRLISALATGKTWYEQKLPNLSLFECINFKTISGSRITQNSFLRSKALIELQQCLLIDWYEQLDEEARKILYQLCQSYILPFLIDNSLITSLDERYALRGTIQYLAHLIYTASREAPTLTQDLAKFSNLLHIGVESLSSAQLLPTLSPTWVPSRVKFLLQGSSYWVQYAIRQEETRNILVP